MDLERANLLYKSFDKSFGPVKLSGSIGATGRFGVEAILDKNPTKVEMHARLEKFGVKAQLTASFGYSKSWGKSGSKAYTLTPKYTLLTEAFAIGFVPVVVVVEVQMMAYLDWEVDAQFDAGRVQISINSFIGIDEADVVLRSVVASCWHQHWQGACSRSCGGREHAYCSRSTHACTSVRDLGWQAAAKINRVLTFASLSFSVA
jgi:hypothetical protein